MSLSSNSTIFTQKIACIIYAYSIWREQYPNLNFFEALRLIATHDKISDLMLMTKFSEQYKMFRIEEEKEKNKINYYINAISSIIILKKINFDNGYIILQYLNYSTDFNYDKVLLEKLNYIINS